MTALVRQSLYGALGAAWLNSDKSSAPIGQNQSNIRDIEGDAQ